MWRQILVWPLLVSVLLAESPVENVEQTEPLGKPQIWNEYLRSFPARFDSGYDETILGSLARYRGSLQVHLVYDPSRPHEIICRFVDKVHEILSIRGHQHSSFCSKDNRLYFADYLPDAPGCSVVAYDLTSGKEVWRTKLHQEQPSGVSAYRNRASISLPDGPYVAGKGREAPGGVVQVKGSETYCDYIEVLDAKTGESLAIKNFRVGFGSSPSADRPSEANQRGSLPQRKDGAAKSE